MSAFTKFEHFVEDLATGKHDFSSHTFKVYFSNATPNAASHAVKGDLAEIAGGNGYTAGGHTATASFSRSGGTVTISGTDYTVTATGGSIGPFQYAVLYNDTQTTPNKPLVGYWNYGGPLTLNVGESITVDFDPAGSNVIMTLQ